MKGTMHLAGSERPRDCTFKDVHLRWGSSVTKSLISLTLQNYERLGTWARSVNTV